MIILSTEKPVPHSSSLLMTGTLLRIKSPSNPPVGPKRVRGVKRTLFSIKII